MSSELFLASAFPNIDLIEEIYEKYCRDPSSVDHSWRQFFDSLDGAELPKEVLFEKRPEPIGQMQPNLSAQDRTLRITKLISAYRTYGHLLAKIDPISTVKMEVPYHLEIKDLGFDDKELSESFPTCGVMSQENASLREIIDTLKETYCGTIGVEYTGLQNPPLEEWLQKQIEPTQFKIQLSIDQKKMILQYLNKSELFEVFLHTKYVGQKRFSIEGAETLIPMLAAVILTGANLGVEEFVLGMAHRGRLNVLSNILNKSYSDIFSEFEDRWQPNSFEGSGDVKYHKGFSSVITTDGAKKVRLNLAPNPSHLEAVNPVVEGQVRAKQDEKGGKAAIKELVPILIHGDAAISGQGIIYETMQMYDLDGYRTGGTIHFVINNQIGFTTLPRDGRSTHYCTDIARAFCAPVFHVNAEDPEGCVYATLLAIEIRQKFHCDVFIDLNCYRKYGHNESDEPAYTQPAVYQLIRNKKPIREMYRDNLIQQGVLEREMAEALEVKFKEALQVELENSRNLDEKNKSPQKPKKSKKPRVDSKALEEEMLRSVKTGYDKQTLVKIGTKICEIPKDFNIHRKLKQLMDDRLSMIKGERSFDWGMGELLAYGTLLWDDADVRLAGQDCGRGTFSHRHAVLMDQDTGEPYCSLKNLKKEQGRFDIVNSLLSEYAALGFEYGYSLGNPGALVLWEAQFGDFSNGAQVMIDQFIASSEQKWGQKNGVTLLLPHGYEGQGPEHSSARIERFLMLAADGNMFIVNPSTPAQLFHLLRRQVLRNSPKPLIVFTPKALLRLPACVSPLKDFSNGTFEDVLDDPTSPKNVRQLVFCSGKVYYDLVNERETRKIKNMAIVRVEQLYPLDTKKLSKIIGSHKQCKDFFWVQEEPENMGAWRYIQPRLQELLPEGAQICHIGRKASAASATGSLTSHKEEYQQMMDDLFNK